MNRVKRKIVLFIILTIVINVIIKVIPTNSLNNEIIQYTFSNNGIETEYISWNDFSNFTQSYDATYIYSSNNLTHLNFSYIGESSSSYQVESYETIIPSVWNISDFDIEFLVKYDFLNNESIGTLDFNIWSFYDSMGNTNLSILSSLTIRDESNTNSGEFLLSGYPGEILEQYSTTPESINLSDQIWFHANRTDNDLSLEIRNSTNHIILQHNFNSNVSKPVNDFEFIFTNGNLTSNFNVALSELYSSLEIKTYEEDPILPYPKQLNDFQDFDIFINDTYVQSNNAISNITMNYYGGSNETYATEYFVYNLEEYGNCTDFTIQMDLEYNYTGYTMLGNMQLLLSSKFDEQGNFIGTLENSSKRDICYARVYDAWNSNGGVFKIGATPDDSWDEYQTQYGSTNQQGKISIILTRSAKILTISIIKNTITILSHNFGEVYKPVNYILVGGYTNANYNNFSETVFSNFDAEMTIDIPEFYQPFIENDANSGGDAGDFSYDPTYISPGTYSGLLSSVDDWDYYSFYVDSNRIIAITLSGPTDRDIDIALYDNNYNYLTGSYGGASNEYCSYTTSSSEFYILEIYTGTGRASYTFTIAISIASVPPQNDAGSGSDASDSFYSAYLISPGTYSGTVGYGNDYGDIYRFYVSNEYQVRVTLNGPSGADFDLFLYNPSNSQVDSDTSGDSNEEVSAYINGNNGYWRTRITASYGSGTYTFTVSLTTTNTIPPDNEPNNIGYIALGIVGVFLVSILGLFFGISNYRKQQFKHRQENRERTESTNTERRQSGYFFTNTENRNELPPYEEISTNAEGHEKEIIDTIYKGYSFDFEEEQ
ncbi:MAG: PPC domain-containing protein [Candidatus Thorarchaeota archaeon]